MKLEFPHYIYGMLQTSDEKNVYGDLQPIAYSEVFSGELQREIYKTIRLGLTNDFMEESSHVYGFFPLFKDGFVAAHYELMELTEPTSRGKPVFSEFIYITLSQLEKINWDVYPIFKAFTNIPYYRNITKDISPIEIEFDNNNNFWLDILFQFPLQIEALLVKYLSSREKIKIISSPDDHKIRLKFLCSIFQCIPQPYRTIISFATLAKDTSDSVRIFFSPHQGQYGQVIEWQAPTIQNLPGVIYVNWISDFIRKSDTIELKKEVSKLTLPQKAKHLKTIGDELDLAVKYKEWYSNRNEYLKIKVVSQLEQLATQIKEFSCIFTKEEAEEWLSFLLVFVMKLTAYDIGVDTLSHYTAMISDDKSRQILVKKIVSEIFLPQKEKDLYILTDFIIHITEYGIKTNQPLLIRFCEEILQNCLNSKQYKKALYLWSKLIQLGWARPTEWFISALTHLTAIQSKDDFLYIVDEIGCPSSKQAFEALLILLKKSSKLSADVPENIKFLDIVNYDDPKKYLEFLPKCFVEIQSYKWLGAQIRFGYENVDGFYQEIPLLIEKIGLKTANNFLENVRDERDDLLTAITSFSIILNQIRKGNSKSDILIKYLSSMEMCQPQYINDAIEILMKHWMIFSAEQLEAMLNFVETKPKLKNINRSSEEIRTAIRKKNRIKRVEDTFTNKIKKDNLGHIIFDFTYDFSQYMDIETWALFEGHIRNRRYLNEYHNYLIQILLENQFYKIDDEKLKEIYSLLNNAELHYEADVFAYWLLFHRGVFINPFDTIYRTLNFSDLSYIQPSHAGMLIGQKKAFDNKRIRSIAARMVEMSPKEAESLIEKLDAYIGKYDNSTFMNRLRTLITDLPPDVIWLEICKALSKQLKSEIKNIN